MDKRIEKNKWTFKRKLLIALISTSLILVFVVFFSAIGKSKLNVKKSSLSIYEVSEGSFEEFIPITLLFNNKGPPELPGFIVASVCIYL